MVYGVTPDSREWLIILCCVNVEGNLSGYYIFKQKKAMQFYLENYEDGAGISMQRTRHG